MAPEVAGESPERRSQVPQRRRAKLRAGKAGTDPTEAEAFPPKQETEIFKGDVEPMVPGGFPKLLFPETPQSISTSPGSPGITHGETLRPSNLVVA